MNKNLKNTIINKFPIISILVLILIYIYLNLPNDMDSILNPKQIGGKPAFQLPPFTPWLYKYRFAFVVLPVLLLLLLIYYIYYNQVIVGKYNDANTSSLFVVGSGSSDNNRSNVFEIKNDGSIFVNSSALSSNGVDTFLKIHTNNNQVYGLKLESI
jgi:hypothetical protein